MDTTEQEWLIGDIKILKMLPALPEHQKWKSDQWIFFELSKWTFRPYDLIKTPDRPEKQMAYGEESGG